MDISDQNDRNNTNQVFLWRTADPPEPQRRLKFLYICTLTQREVGIDYSENVTRKHADTGSNSSGDCLTWLTLCEVFEWKYVYTKCYNMYKCLYWLLWGQALFEYLFCSMAYFGGSVDIVPMNKMTAALIIPAVIQQSNCQKIWINKLILLNLDL